MTWRFALVAAGLAISSTATVALSAKGETAASVGVQSVVVRAVADGPGPSHVFVIGDYVLVVDPWSAEIRRYEAGDLTTPPARCAYPRDFAPGRTVRTPGGVRLVGEPYGPNDRGDAYRLRSRRTMAIDLSAVKAMSLGGRACPFPIGGYRAALDHAPKMARMGKGGAGASVTSPLPGGARTRVAPVGGRDSEIFGMRVAGQLSGGRSLLWWSEVNGYAAGSDTPPTLGGRVTASQYVGIVGAEGSSPENVIRIRTASYPSIEPGSAIAISRLLIKPGLEYVAAGVAGGRDTLWIVTADMAATAPRPFVLRQYALADVTTNGITHIDLIQTGAASVDRNDAVSATSAQEQETSVSRSGAPLSRPAWFVNARRLLQRQVGFRWQWPTAATDRPCGGPDRCPVAADAQGAPGIGTGFDSPVADKIDTGGGANWMRPRQLIGASAGQWYRGIPYSIGGMDLADRFAAGLADYGRTTTLSAPIGHIREGLEWPTSQGNYPLGIDCSALVAQVFGLTYRTTAEMVAPRVFRATDGRVYAVPSGPAHACAEPVRRFADLQPGDLFVRDGHVVIFAGTVAIDGGLRSARGVRVFESSSRCGAVCESIYDPTYFDGWWMVRLSLGPDGKDCPHWLDPSGSAATEKRR